MSVEEEVELRDLVAQTLELNGCLPKIRAQLRANLFLALDEDTKVNKQRPCLNNKIKSHLETEEGQLMFCLVREFLEYFNLDFTISVYESESYIGSCYKYEGRQKIVEDLGLKTVEDISGPILLQLLKIVQVKEKNLKIDLTHVNSDKNDYHKQSNGSTSLAQDKISINGNLSQRKGGEHHLSNSHKPNHTINVGNTHENDHASIKASLNSTFTKGDIDNDDTFNGTSSIEEETVNGNENSVHLNNKSTLQGEESSSSLSQDTSPESKSKSDDKFKTPLKCDKLKSKLELSHLQLNKSRGSDILPSLYNKDFKERNNKDFDFDIKDDYEEDFMSGSEVEFSLSKVDCPKPLLEELQQYEHPENVSNSFANITAKDEVLVVDKQKDGDNSNSDNKITSSINDTTYNNKTSVNVDRE